MDLNKALRKKKKLAPEPEPTEKKRKKRQVALGLDLDYKKSKHLAKAVNKMRKDQEEPEFDLFADVSEQEPTESSLTKQTSVTLESGTSSKKDSVSEPTLPSERREKDHEERKKKQRTQGTTPEAGATNKQLQITIDYSTSNLPATHQMLMEVVADKIQGNHDEKDIDYWWNYMNTVGSLPFHTIFKDDSRYFTLLYAASFIVLHGSSDAETRNLGSRKQDNPDYDPYERNVAQEGQHWGIQVVQPPATHIDPKERQAARDAKKQAEQVPLNERGDTNAAINYREILGLQSTDPFGPGFVPINDKGQVIADGVTDKTKEAIERNPNLANMLGLLDDTKLSKIAPKLAPPQPLDVRTQVETAAKENVADFIEKDTVNGEPMPEAMIAPDNYTIKWQEADRLSLQAKESWQNAPFELRTMVQWCYGHRRDTVSDENPQGLVPTFPTNMLEVYTYRPKFVTPDPVVWERRETMREKIKGFWEKSVEANRDKINLASKSYRVTLAAINLRKAIEDYSNSVVDADAVKNAALRYFQAHFPVEALGAKPGPISTLDPTYDEYMKLCQKYNLTPGTLLHEAKL